MNSLMFYESYYENCLTQFEKLQKKDPIEGDSFDSLNRSEHLKDLNQDQNGNYSFQTFFAADKNLISVDGIQNLYVFNVFLQNNKLEDVNQIGKMKQITHLDLSNNFIQNLPPSFTKLKLVNLNLQNNQLKSFPSLNLFKFLKILNLSLNNLRELENKDLNQTLEYLDISMNPIYTLCELQHLDQLSMLICNQTKITNLEGIQNMKLLRILKLNRNSIYSIEQLQSLSLLQKLDMSFNQLDDLMQVEILKDLQYLIELDFSGNPLHKTQFYKEIVLNVLKKLRKLDGCEITPNDYLDTAVFFGHDQESKKEIFEKLLPKQKYNDTRLVHSEMECFTNLTTKKYKLLNVDFLSQLSLIKSTLNISSLIKIQQIQ